MMETKWCLFPSPTAVNWLLHAWRLVQLQVGACGICCDVCFAFKENGGTCGGCYSGLDAPTRKLEESICPIIKCAARREVDYCSKSCREFPCLLYTKKPYPYSHEYLKVVKTIPRVSENHLV